MKCKLLFIFNALFFFMSSNAQFENRFEKDKWVDSVYNSLTQDQRIAQLMVVRAHSNLGQDHIAKIANEIKKYNIGALCFFQGGPVRQANLTNYYQSLAQTPILITTDGEWGLAMRLDSITKLPYQLTLGALTDERLIYKMGMAVGQQCKRLGVHVNYAPVVDINSNPSNPVIGYRSLGENKNKVSRLGAAYIKGMQDAGIMACAKHFPGHGDVAVDSHYDLPLINKTKEELLANELVPFKAAFDAGVGSVMIAHLYIPAIDDQKNRATSLSKNNVTELLKNEMGYKGLCFTDALEMKGVTKFFPGSTISVEALIAGNDMLCLPEDVPQSIEAIKNAIAEKKLSWTDIDEKVKKALAAKYQLGLNKLKPIDTLHLVEELNAQTDEINDEVARQSITLITQAGLKSSRNDYAQIPLTAKHQKIAYIGLGLSTLNSFGKKLKENYNADVFLLDYKQSEAAADKIVATVQKDGRYDAIIIGVHNYSLKPSNNFGISNAAISLYKQLNFIKTITISFGNVLANKNFCDAWTLVAAYQDDKAFHHAAFDLLSGKSKATGTLPVGFCTYQQGDGMAYTPVFDKKKLPPVLDKIDSVVTDAIAQEAFPGCVVLASHCGEMIYQKAFGRYTYSSQQPITTESIFDLASVTKTSATTLAIMKLYEEGKIDLQKTLGDYLPEAIGTNKAGIKIEDMLLHQSGLQPFIVFYKETVDSNGKPHSSIYASQKKEGFDMPVADHLFLRNDWSDTMLLRIMQSQLWPRSKYEYSDNNFIFLGKIIKSISGLPLDEYVKKTFYQLLGLNSIGFNPLQQFVKKQIVPTETEYHFRNQQLQGYVHDEGAAMFGGVAGHAGLFSTAYDLSVLYQMLLNGGIWNGVRYLKRETIDLFTGYRTKNSRRGYGFDKPEQAAPRSVAGNNVRKGDSYPSALASPFTYGHTGFTGTCVWVDPAKNLVFIFLSNRVSPTRNNKKITTLNVRGKILDLLYQALEE